MSARSVCLILPAALVAGCASSRMPETSFGQPQALERAVKSYYASHATEENGTCSMPYMDGLTHVEVLEERPEHLALEVGYLYRDRRKNDGLVQECVGYDERRFTLAKSAAGIEMLNMTGPQHGAGSSQR